jgi:hypothetical protein
MARIHNLFKSKPRGVKAPGKGSGKATEKITEHEVTEDRVFSFTTKLLSDCTGSLFSKTASTELSEAETAALVDRFASLLALDRKSEAMDLLSPAIRYSFPGGASVFMLREHVQLVGANGFGKPVAEKPPEGKAQGVNFVGKNRVGKKTYSTIRAEKIGGQDCLTFFGTSTQPDRKTWDLLVVKPGNIYSGVVKTLKL